MNDWFSELTQSARTVWLPEEGVGFSRVDAPKDDYFDHYDKLESSGIGRALNAARVQLVSKYTTGEVVDIGIGNGAFIRARGGQTFGYDVDKKSVAWLKREGLLQDVYTAGAESVTMWDSLEHIPDPAALLDRVRRYAFISTPIMSGDLIASKHYKPGEHCWYFTADGLERMMAAFGFVEMERNAAETVIGRESVMSFVFKRRSCG